MPATLTTVPRNWHFLDANHQVLGRLATRAAQLLMGKHKAGFVRYHDHGDYVVVVNARQIQVTGNKETQKTYDSYSGYPGGLKQTTVKMLRAKHPERILEHAIFGMLPKNRLAASFKRRLKIFADDQHPHESQLKK